MPAALQRFRRPLLACGAATSGVALVLLTLLAVRADPAPLIIALLALLLLVPTTMTLAYARALTGRGPEALRRWALGGGAIAATTTLVLAYGIGVVLLDRALAAKDYSAAYSECRKVWATRGLVEPGLTKVASAGNSAATVNNAFAHGAPGVEVDVYYDAELADFVVSHDFPYERKGGVLLMLDQLLAQTDPARHYWLDFKRHGQLTRAQAEAAALRLATIAGARGVARQRLWVEGTEPFNLMPFVHAGFSIIFDVHPPRDRHWSTPLVTQLHKAMFLAGGFTVMGMNYGTTADPIYGPVARQLLGDIPVFL